MPQIFNVLRCYKCTTFQVYQVKKSNKWECKLCGEKQSIKRHYGIGTAKDCRLQVQKLNGIQGEAKEKIKAEINSDSDEDFEPEKCVSTYSDRVTHIKSKWDNFIDKEDITETVNTDIDIVPQVPVKCKRKKWQAPLVITENDNFHKPTELKENLNLHWGVGHSTNFAEKSQVNVSNPIPDLPKNKHCHQKNPHESNKNSKWAQFTDDLGNGDSEDVMIKKKPKVVFNEPIIKKKENLFSMPVNDDDLDKILDL